MFNKIRRKGLYNVAQCLGHYESLNISFHINHIALEQDRKQSIQVIDFSYLFVVQGALSNLKLRMTAMICCQSQCSCVKFQLEFPAGALRLTDIAVILTAPVEKFHPI